MIPIRPINEELNRLHQPVVSAEEDDSFDTALQGFNVTSFVRHPEVASAGRLRRASDSMVNGSTIHATTTVVNPSFERYRGRGHHHSYSNGSYNGSRYNRVVYPPVNAAVSVESLGIPPYSHNRRHHHHHRQTHGHQNQHYCGCQQQQPRYTLRPTAMYGSPGTIPRVSW